MQKPPFRFLDLPPEIRLGVYSQILHPDLNRAAPGEDGCPRYAFDLSIFRVCKQIYQESAQAFLSLCTFVRLETPWIEAYQHMRKEGRIAALANGAQAKAFKFCSLTIQIQAPMFRDPQADADHESILMLADDLPAFCEMWFYSDLSYDGELNKHFTVVLRLCNPLHNELALPFATQKRLLEPFGSVKRLRLLLIKGEYAANLEQALRAEMSKPEKPQEQCLEEALKLRDAGDLAYKKKQPREAIELYIQSFRAIYIVCEGRERSVWAERWFNRTLTTGPLRGQEGAIIALSLRVRLVSGVVRSYLALQDYDEAYYWGNRSISLFQAQSIGEDVAIRSFPFPTDVAVLYFHTGLAAKQKGMLNEARRLFRVAYDFLPDDEQVRSALASVTPLLTAG